MKEEQVFDEICMRVFPLILFMYTDVRKQLLEKVAALYSALDTKNYDLFSELVSQIDALIAERRLTDSNKERLIQSFYDRSRSYHQQFVDVNRKIVDLERRMRRLSKSPGSQQLDVPVILEKHVKGRRSDTGESNVSRTLHCPYCDHIWQSRAVGKTHKDGSLHQNCGMCKKWFKEK